jgi:hypothetical protein
MRLAARVLTRRSAGMVHAGVIVRIRGLGLRFTYLGDQLRWVSVYAVCKARVDTEPLFCGNSVLREGSRSRYPQGTSTAGSVFDGQKPAIFTLDDSCVRIVAHELIKGMWVYCNGTGSIKMSELCSCKCRVMFSG